MITQMFAQLGDWTWIVLGVVLMGLELLAPGTFLMWFGLAAIAVGFFALLLDLPWQAEFVLFGVFALAFIVIGRRFFARLGNQSNDTPGLNDRASAFVGREVTLKEAMVGGTGRVKIGDTLWRVEGDDAPAGARLRVTGVRGATLQVEKIS